MKRALIVASLLGASTGVASAGTYLGIGVGPTVGVSDNQSLLKPTNRSWRALVGMRFGHLSLEAGLDGFGFTTPTKGKNFDGLQETISAKYSVPLSAGFEAFGRAGFQRTGLSSSTDSSFDASGSGILLGAGVEYRLNLVATEVSIWLDYTYSKGDIDGGRSHFDGASTRLWMLGVSVGI